MDHLNSVGTDTSVAKTVHTKLTPGVLLFPGGILLMLAAVFVGALIEDRLQARGMHGGASQIGILPLLFGFGFPAGVFLSALGALLRGPRSPSFVLLFFLLGVPIVLSALVVPSMAGRGADSAYFGIGGILVMLCVGAAFWFWGELRTRVSPCGLLPLDLLGAALVCFATAAWNLCGSAAMPSFLLEPEKVLALGTRAFAIGQMKAVMALIVLGWVFMAASLGLAARDAKRWS